MEKRYVVIDMGGTAIKYASMDDELRVFAEGSVPSDLSGHDGLFRQLKEIYEEVGEGASGVAISMPGVIDPSRGFAFSGGSYRWILNIPLAEELSQSLGIPVTIANDAKCSALAELGYGSLQGVKNALVYVIGTGVGGAIIIDGKLYMGQHFGAGEFSFIQGDYRKRDGGNDFMGRFGGINGLSAAVQETSGLSGLNGIEIFRQVREGNQEVLKGVQMYCDRFALQVVNLQSILDVEKVAIGGGISAEPLFIELLTDAVKEQFDRLMMGGIAMPQIVACQFRNRANQIGALYNYHQQI